MREQTNLGDYADPIIYDSENPREPAEAGIQFYLGLCKRVNDSVLELGCGTGRFTIPIAQAGFAITGLDVVPGMLQRAREKSQGLPVRWVQADARNFHLNQKFALIFESGAMFRHLLERVDHEACLACVHAHLTDAGLFVISANILNAEKMQPHALEDWYEHTDGLGRHVRVSGSSRYDPLRQVYHEDATRRWLNDVGEEVIAHAPLALRQFFPQEMEALLHYNGFAIIERYGSWDGRALNEDSPFQIYVCSKR